MFADQPKKREKRIERRTLENERRGGACKQLDSWPHRRLGDEPHAYP